MLELINKCINSKFRIYFINSKFKNLTSKFILTKNPQLPNTIISSSKPMKKSNINFELLKQMCNDFAPTGNEAPMKEFVLNYIKENQKHWKVQPQIIEGEDFQDCLILVFGKPRTAAFSHFDSIGFMARYDNHLVRIGSPKYEDGYVLVGKDSQGQIEGTLKVKYGNENEKDKKKKKKNKKKKRGSRQHRKPLGEVKLQLEFDRTVDVGTEFVFKQDFKETEDYVQSCYMDDRLGCWNLLKTAETLENGILAFSCYEEIGGGTMPFLLKWMWENYKIKQCLISDITWITEGVKHGEGVAVSMRDRNIPRRSFLNKIIDLVKESGINYQLEVENDGGSDAKEIQSSAYPMDWCFIGAAEDNVHSPTEKVHKDDIKAMTDVYAYLMEKL